MPVIAMAAAMAALLLLPATAIARPLEEVLALVYASNPNLQAQRESLRRTDEEVPKALSNWRPKVNGEYARTSARLQQDFGPDRERTFSARPDALAIRLSQPIYQGGRATAAVREAEANVDAQRARLRDAEQRVFMDTVRAYVAVVSGEEILELNDSNVRILRELVRATRERVRRGDATRTDMALAEARLARAMSDRAGVLHKLEAMRSAFEAIVGERPGRLTMPGPPGFGPRSLRDLRDAARTRHPSVSGTKAQERGSAASTDFAVGDLMPKVSLRLSAGRDLDTMLRERRRDELAAAVVLEVPIFQGGVEHARVRQAKIAQGQRRLETDINFRQLDDEANAAWSEHEMLTTQLPLFDRQIEAAEIAFDGATRELAAGARTLTEVLAAEQDLLNARVAKTQAIGQLVVSSYQVLEIAGLLDAVTLGLKVDPYDPEANYRKVRDKWFGLGEQSEEGTRRR